MSYSVDWEAGVITIPIADLVFQSATRYTLDLRDFKLECWRLTWEELEGLSYPEILTYYPPIAEINQAETILINFDDYIVIFEAGNYLVEVFGAGTNVYNYVVMNGVSVRSSGGVAVTVDGGAVASDVNVVSVTGTPVTDVDDFKTDISGIPTATENAEAIASYTR